MRDIKVISSVLGMDLRADIKDINDNLLPTGCKKTIHPNKKIKIKSRLLDKKFFTNFNQALLDKIIEYRKLND
jgi:hypothetical protein